MPVDDRIAILLSGGIIMICVGIDVARDKYNCFTLSSKGEVLADVFTITETGTASRPWCSVSSPALSLLT